MTKDEARKLLEDWLNEMVEAGREIRLPIVDQNVIFMIEEDVKFTQYTFKGLIKIAYDL